MEIKPINQSKNPNYPILEYYVENPEILARNIPNRWIKNKYIATSISVFVLCGNASCGQKLNFKDIEIATTLKGGNLISSSETKENNKDTIKIAPIFAHGKGSGATGCVVMSPPVFISEDEARQIIFNALAAENILFDTANCPIIKFQAPPIADECFGFHDKKDTSVANVELEMDAYNAEYNLAIQFVSTKDFFKFRSDNECWSSVQGFDTKKAATFIREELNANGNSNAVVFYDPITRIVHDENKNWDASKKQAKNEAKELLLAQVNDFIEWFKKEIITK